MVRTEDGAVVAEIKNDPITEIEHYYRQVIDNLPVAVYTCDTKGRITQFNKAAVCLTGHESETGKDTWYQLLPEIADNLPPAMDSYAIEDTLNEGWSQKRSRIVQSDGTVVPVTVYLKPITDTDYRLCGATFTLVRESVPDTVYHFFKKTEQKQEPQPVDDLEAIRERAQELIRINEQLEKSNHELQHFAYVASHDLQEPLRKIQTFLELTRSNYGNEEAFEKYYSKVYTSAHRMSRFVAEILKYSRLSTSDLAFEPTDLDKILSEVKMDLELLIEQKNVSIISNALPVIPGIPLQIHQLFNNLISNSIKFCKTNPQIRINATKLSPEELLLYPELKQGHDHVKLTFTDNGIGFEQQHAEKIFVIFQRLNSTHDYSGTGIGLAMCKKIAENHHGLISATSKKDEGTTICVILPC